MSEQGLIATEPHQTLPHICTWEQKSALGLVLPPFTEVEDWNKPREGCCWDYARDQLMWPWRHPSLGGTESLKMQRKGYCEAQTSWCCPEAELQRDAKIWAVFQSYLDIALCRISWIFVIQVILDWYHSAFRILDRGNGINKSSSGMRNKLLCIQSGMQSHPSASLKIRKTLISLLIGRIQSDIIR